jgi:DNA-binding NarL/FixJ family response regulator
MTIDPRPRSPNHIHKFKELWSSPKRTRVLQARADGKSWTEIATELGLPKSTCRTIWKSQKERKNRQQRGGVQAMMSAKEVRKVIREISKT